MDHITNLCNTNHNKISFLEFHPKYINNVEEYILFKKKSKFSLVVLDIQHFV